MVLIAELAHEEEIAYSITHSINQSINQSPSLFNAPQTEALALRNIIVTYYAI